VKPGERKKKCDDRSMKVVTDYVGARAKEKIREKLNYAITS
jgi:hypothetical protein